MEFYMPAATADDFVEMGEACSIGPLSFIRKRKGSIFSLAVYLLGLVLSFVLPGRGALMLSLTYFMRAVSIFGLIYWLLMLASIYTTRRYNAQKALTLNSPSWVTIDETGISLRMEDGSYQTRFAWGMMQKMIVSENLYILIMKNGVAIFFSRWLAPPELDMRQVAQNYFPAVPVVEIKTELKRKTPPAGYPPAGPQAR